MLFNPYKVQLPNMQQALAGRPETIMDEAQHCIFNRSLKDQPQNDEAEIWMGLGCFWGAERLFWKQEAVQLTAVGYAGGFTQNPTYQEVCSGHTAHTEVVRILYLDHVDHLKHILKVFWEAHDPTQGMRQGNDVGTQYRSAIYCQDQSQYDIAMASLQRFQDTLSAQGVGEITTEVSMATQLYYAEEYHQQYLHKNPSGYCGLRGTGAVCSL